MRIPRRFIWIAVCTIIGALLATVLFVMRERGYFEQWHKLAIAPLGAIELFSDETGAIYVKTSSDETYHLDWCEGGGCWVKGKVSQDVVEVRPAEVTKSCDFSSPEFSLFANAPRGIIDCTQTLKPQTDGLLRCAYVLDEDGTVWHWYTGASADPSVHVMCACIVALGAMIGLSIGIGTSAKTLSRAAKRKSGPANRCT